MEVSMKKVVYVLLGFLIIMAMVAGVGCTPKPVTPVTTNVTGTVTGNPIVTVGGNETITINTPTGPQIFPVNPTATTTFEGQACTLDQFNQYVTDNATYNCTIVMNDVGEAVAVYVHNP
jgi:hypothetical protein